MVGLATRITSTWKGTLDFSLSLTASENAVKTTPQLLIPNDPVMLHNGNNLNAIVGKVDYNRLSVETFYCKAFFDFEYDLMFKGNLYSIIERELQRSVCTWKLLLACYSIFTFL